MTTRAILRRGRALLVLIWAVLLLCLVPLFFMNYGGAWLHRLAEIFPLTYPQ